MIDILDHTDVICLAMNNGDFPYIIPVNFGFELTSNNQLIFYIHDAKVGTKVELLKQNRLFSFELDTGYQLITNEKAYKYSFNYASVIGNEYATFIEEPSAKIEALQIMMNKVAPNKNFSFTEGNVRPIIVIKIEVQAYNAKKH
ncbi:MULTISPECIES: pyridoxamine 5'-phosphate oxidase family protein [unclassified Gilliamella]|uniref:pyridoxamine 5'-phosphate oxidase family protein n=1 Tax=unclassified Gilliamella TaxID=2685620 RepID=UPI0018DCCF6D|nr:MULTISPECIES: pyridoxamine 5'-phosphate oxidase family protein [unclassified Gilliamella]MBI0029522.1 pyridoxamine 5'-phosphate oxidase family protein [Gilliamella sp. B14448G7]MBI0030382.1 pyridoxamine 5'-phosphate oxidase family protein [Gilliamella sp. B14384G15]MBI0036505.1 pyridoxamine 5'-phosphate oxidase family protein [Gilliamella sp. B14448G11]MBI0043681.1 pyridoxamine 5'-phosphate oxidase family protein [Gilliamella sp. B14448G12]MBI0056986.1 pyridoxamine 5'-phosphate oxidase fami